MRGDDADALLDLVIPGAQKAGTSTLLSVLGRHSKIQRHPSAECGALLDPDRPLRDAVAAEYPPTRHSSLRVAKSAGLMHDHEALRRLVEACPEIRFLVMLREPVARAESAFWFARRTGDETRSSLRAALAAGTPREDVPPARRRWVQYLERSDYVEALRLIRGLVGPDRLHIVLLEDYKEDPDAVLSGILAWLDLPSEPLLDSGPTRVNAAATARSLRMARALRYSGPLTRGLRRVLPRSLGRAARRRLLALNETTTVSKPPRDAELVADLRARFQGHNRTLATEFDLDLGRWATELDEAR